jgi:hypothetical protein
VFPATSVKKPIGVTLPQVCAKHMILPAKLQIIVLKSFIFAENAYKNT